jgi:hypothetical protein
MKSIHNIPSIQHHIHTSPKRTYVDIDA